MIRKNASKYIPMIGKALLFIPIFFFQVILIFTLIVPQILAMMIDLDDDPEWSIQDEIEDEDEER